MIFFMEPEQGKALLITVRERYLVAGKTAKSKLVVRFVTRITQFGNVLNCRI